MEKKMVTVTFAVYIGVALLIGYRMYKMENGPTNSELIQAIENGAANATREHYQGVEKATSETASQN